VATEGDEDRRQGGRKMERMDQACGGNGMKNIFKLGLLIVLGIVLIISVIILFSQESVPPPQRSTDPDEIKTANKTIENILEKNQYGVIKKHEGKKTYLEIKVDKDSWKRLSIREKKAFIKDLADARATIGLNPSIKVIDYESSVEYASFENNRVTLAEFDL